MNQYRPKRVLIEKAVEGSRIARYVRERLQAVPVQIFDSLEQLLEQARASGPSISAGKRDLVLAKHRGAFFKPCPAAQVRGTSRNVCCDYFVVNFASNCHMECSYCYLQGYLNFPPLVVHANHDDLLAEMAEVFSNSLESFFRVGTGELADSLALDDLTGYSIPLVEFFAKQPNAVLEFKTKSDRVDNLLSLNHCGRTVVSWSMNTPHVQETEEHKTATIQERISAAERCVDAGYPVAFHFDPLVFYEGWEKDYRHVITELFDRIPAASVAWVSVGALRMTHHLRDVMRTRFSASPLALAELTPCEDGKLRYVKPIRRAMYEAVVGWLRERISAQTGLYACMERPEVWRRVFQPEIPKDEEVGLQVTRSIHRETLQPKT